MDLTICSASFHSQRYIDLNNTLLAAVTTDYEWLVSQNGPPESFETKVTTLQGEQSSVTSNPDAPEIYEASFHHAAALNRLKDQVKTRYMLALDPDFFIIQPLHAIISYMQNNGVSIFGAPYNPISLKHYRYFPAAFCMFIDLETVKDVDFMPGYGGLADHSLKPDTGYKIYSRNRSYKHESVIPTCSKPPEDYDRTKYSSKLFKNRGFFDAAGLGWEEFYFNGLPFAIHTHMKIHGKIQRHDKDTVDAFIRKQLTQVKTCVTTIRSQNDQSFQSRGKRSSKSGNI